MKCLVYVRAGVPGVFGSLESEPLEKKPGAGAGAGAARKKVRSRSWSELGVFGSLEPES